MYQLLFKQGLNEISTYSHPLLNLLQVETVGDTYMAVSGLPEPCADHARCIARMALEMIELSKTVMVDGVPIVVSSLSLFEILGNKKRWVYFNLGNLLSCQQMPKEKYALSF